MNEKIDNECKNKEIYIVYNEITKDVLMIIGSDEEVIQNRYYYDFISHSDYVLKDIKGKVKYIKGDK